MNGRFPPSSRYAKTAITTLDAGDGRMIAHLRRRFLPQPDRLALVVEHEVSAGERLDGITARYLDDPEQFWRVCDGNAVMRPDELTDEVGRRIRITLPEGLEGPSR